MVLETGIFASQAIWLWRVRHVRREAKAAGQTYDEYVAAHPSKRLQSESSETVVDVEACHASRKSSVCTDEKSEGPAQAIGGDEKKEVRPRVDSVTKDSLEEKEDEANSHMGSATTGDEEVKGKASVYDPTQTS
jgi:hypothetical protein